MDVVNAQWTLTYDKTKLKFNAENNVSNKVQTITPVVGSQLVYKQIDGRIKGNFTNLNMYTFDDAKFVSVTFDIIGSGVADVYLDLEILSVGYMNEDFETIDQSIVDYSEIQDISGIKGFENASISMTSEITCGVVLGDVNGDGMVTVVDVTDVLKYAVEIIDFSGTQKMAADVDGDGYITVKDATTIQKAIAGLIKL